MDQSSSIIELFEVSQVTCKQSTHHEQAILALCLRAECNQMSAQCLTCIQQLHQFCLGSLKRCEDVPQLVIPLQSMRSKLLELKINVNLKMNKLIKFVEDTLMPISQYSNYPTLTNLNKLGAFLKLKIEPNIKKQLETAEEEIKSLFQQCKNNLHMKSPQEVYYEGLEKNSNKFSYFLVQQLIKEDKAKDALKIIEAALLKNQNDKRLLLNKGQILYQLNRFQEAIICYDLAIKIDPAYSLAWYHKGISLWNLDQNEEALHCFSQATNIDPAYSEAFNQKGFVLDELKRYQEAIICQDQAIKIDPNYVLALNNKGRSLDELKRYQEAIICYDQAIKIDPNYVLALNNKGRSLDELKRYQEAIICFDQAIKIDPNYVTALSNKGASLNDLKRYQEAINILDQGIKIDPHYQNCYKNKGYSLIGLKRYEEAIPCFEQALELKPGYEEAITGLKIAKEELKKLKK